MSKYDNGNGFSHLMLQDRKEHCEAKGLCFISLQPLGITERVAVIEPYLGKVAIHTKYVTPEVWGSGMVSDGAENVSPSISQMVDRPTKWNQPTNGMGTQPQRG